MFVGKALIMDVEAFKYTFANWEMKKNADINMN